MNGTQINQAVATEADIPYIAAILTSAVTQFDMKASKKRGYNIYALAQYFAAVTEVEAALAAGMPIRKAVCKNFCDRLCDACLRALGLPLMTEQERW